MNKIALAALSLALAVPGAANDMMIPPPNGTIRQISAPELVGLRYAMRAVAHARGTYDDRESRKAQYTGYLYAYGDAAENPVFFATSEELEKQLSKLGQGQREAAAYATSAINITAELRPDGSQSVKGLWIGSYWGHRPEIKSDGSVVYSDVRQLRPDVQKHLAEAIARWSAWGRAQNK